MGDFRAVEIPAALRSHFDVDYAPSCLLEYDPEAFDLPEITAALAVLRTWATDPEPAFAWRREWAAAEWERASAAAVGVKRQPQAGKALDRELGELHDWLAKSIGEHLARPGFRYLLVGLAAKENRGSTPHVPVLFCGNWRPGALRLGDVETPYRAIAMMKGLTLANVRQRISRYRDRAGTKLVQTPRGRGRTRVP